MRTHFSARLILLLLIAWGLLTIKISVPFFGYQDSNAAWIANGVRNFQLYGADTLGFMPVFNTGLVTDGHFTYYAHNSPMVLWTASLLLLPFGFHEALLRFIPAAATMVSICALYVIVRRLYNEKLAFWTAALYIFTPMTAFFGRLPSYEALIPLFATLFTAVFIQWMRRPTRGRWLALVVLAVLGVWTATAVILYLLAFAIAVWMLGTPRQRWGYFAILTAGALGTFGWVALYQSHYPDTITDLLSAFSYRSSNQTWVEGSPRFTLIEYLAAQAAHLAVMFTPSTFLLMFVGIWPTFRLGSRESRWIVFALLLGGASWSMVFPNLAYIHDYIKIFVTPPAAIIAANGVAYAYARRTTAARWLHPAVTGMLITIPLGFVAAMLALHGSSDQPDSVAMARDIGARTGERDLILSNLPYIGFQVEFYAFRTIYWQLPPEAALERASQSDEDAYYFFCGEQEELNGLFQPTAEAALSDRCWLIPIVPTA